MMAPAGTLGQTSTATGALIGTYCTTNNIGTGGLSDVVSTYTGDFITIAGKLFFKKIISYSSSMIRLNFHNFVAKNLMFCISNSRICIYLFKNWSGQWVPKLLWNKTEYWSWTQTEHWYLWWVLLCSWNSFFGNILFFLFSKDSNAHSW